MTDFFDSFCGAKSLPIHAPAPLPLAPGLQLCPRYGHVCVYQCAISDFPVTRPNGQVQRMVTGCVRRCVEKMRAHDALPSKARLEAVLKAGDYHGHKTRRRDSSILDLYM